ncbi:MAG: methyltransferase domain-containing protein, partial [Pseudorhodoplanes sp.]|nr:methyltransferase domain-containing protein [Pseudorhodoplanes sp.]
MNRKARRAARSETVRRTPQRAPAAGPNLVDLAPALAYHSLGLMLASEGRHEDALDSFIRCIELEPQYWEAHHGLCRSLMALGQFGSAAAHCQQLAALNPGDALTLNNLALARLGAGDAGGALDAVCRALAVDDLTESRSILVLCAQAGAGFPDTPAMRALMARAMREPWGRPADLSLPCARLVMADPAMAAVVAAIDAAWPQPPAELLASPGFAAAARDPLLRCLLENAPIADHALERALTAIRAAMLERAVAVAPHDGMDADTLAFFCALSRQCFINEYVFDLQPREIRLLDNLRDRTIAALHAGAALCPLRLAALAAYAPLHDLGLDAALLARAWPQPVADLLTQQVREPAQEARLRGAIPRLTSVADGVSVAVRRQYEENPYPRWAKAAPSGKTMALNARLQAQFPLAGFRPLDLSHSVAVLVAGCGTGQQLVDVAQRIAQARVLAVDLSLASLAYAKRKTDELGLANIEYGQADILKLGALGRRFDMVDCGGVLHHLGDPEAGWRVLVSLLKPGGVMRIALYSEVARRHVVAARAFVAERGYLADADGLRKFRRDVRALPDDDVVKLVARSPDFFTLS